MPLSTRKSLKEGIFDDIYALGYIGREQSQTICIYMRPPT